MFKFVSFMVAEEIYLLTTFYKNLCIKIQLIYPTELYLLLVWALQLFDIVLCDFD